MSGCVAVAGEFQVSKGIKMDQQIEHDFNAALDLTDEPVAAALLVLASAVRSHGTSFSFGDMLSHGICLGIQKGFEKATISVNVSE